MLAMRPQHVINCRPLDLPLRRQAPGDHNGLPRPPLLALSAEIWQMSVQTANWVCLAN